MKQQRPKRQKPDLKVLSNRNWADYPQSVTEIKSSRSGLACDSRPRDCLIEALRDVDTNKDSPCDGLCVVMTGTHHDGSRWSWYITATGSIQTTLGILEEAKQKIFRDAAAAAGK